MYRSVLAFVILMLLSTRAAVDAGVILQPVAIVANTAGEQSGLEAVHLIDQSGLVVPYISGVTDFGLHSQTQLLLDTTGAVWNSDPFVMAGVMVFDLGEVVQVSGMALWQATNYYSQDIREFTLRGDLDGDFSSGASNIGSFSGQPNRHDSPVSNTLSANVYQFGPVSARYLEWSFVNMGNAFGTIANEVAFEAASVPEPCSLTISLLGAGLLAVGGLRRRLRSRRP